MGGMMGGGSAQKPTRFGTLDFQTSQLGAPIPTLWGRNKISFNVVWTGPLHSKKLGKMSGKGGGKRDRRDRKRRRGGGSGGSSDGDSDS